MHVGPDRQVLGLLEGPLGQRHLAHRLLSHLRGLGEPGGLALWVEEAVTLPSLLGNRQHSGQCPHRTAPLSFSRDAKPPDEVDQACDFPRAPRKPLVRQGLGFRNIFEI